MSEERLTTIYFIDDGTYIKIGRSNNLEQRRETLQVANPNALTILYTLPNMSYRMESHIHGICNRFHVSGEWFKKEVIAHLMAIPYYKERLLAFIL